MWLRHDDCINVVKSNWDNWNGYNNGVKDKLERCKKGFQEWNRRVFRHVQTQIAEKALKLDEIGESSTGVERHVHLKATRGELNELLAREKCM